MQNEFGVDPIIYLTPWHICLYTGLPEWHTVMRIWDIFMLEGEAVLGRVSYAILCACEGEHNITPDPTDPSIRVDIAHPAGFFFLLSSSIDHGEARSGAAVAAAAQPATHVAFAHHSGMRSSRFIKDVFFCLTY